MICAKCGAKIDEKSIFCDKCGQNVYDYTPKNYSLPPAENPMQNQKGENRPSRVCANCGTQLDDDSVFCKKCGQSVSAAYAPQYSPGNYSQQLTETPRQYGKVEEKPQSRVCPSCGAQVAENAIFCDKCGQNVSAYVSSNYSQQPAGTPWQYGNAEIKPQSRVCTKCGASLNENAAFCDRCGQSVYYAPRNYTQQPAAAIPQRKFTGLEAYYKSERFKGLFIALMILSGVMLVVMLVVPYIVLQRSGDSYSIYLVRENSYPKYFDNIDRDLIMTFIMYLIGLCGTVVTVIMKKFGAAFALSCTNFIWIIVSVKEYFDKIDSAKKHSSISGTTVGVFILFALISGIIIITSMLWWETKNLKGRVQPTASNASGGGNTA